jgi:hypothetical protein
MSCWTDLTTPLPKLRPHFWPSRCGPSATLIALVYVTVSSCSARERRQAADVRSGLTLRSLLRFDEYLATRSLRLESTFREHLRIIGGAIEA